MRDTPVECRKAPASIHGERQEVRVGELAIAHHFLEGRFARRCGRDIIAPKHMPGYVQHPAKEDARLLRHQSTRQRPCVARYPHEARFRDRTGGPTRLSYRVKPGVGSAVVEVAGPRERDENIHVQEAYQISSNASATISGVIGGASSGTSTTGNPLIRDTGPLAVAARRGRKARRISAEATAPKLSPRSRARLFTARWTSASRFNVVLMMLHHRTMASQRQGAFSLGRAAGKIRVVAGRGLLL